MKFAESMFRTPVSIASSIASHTLAFSRPMTNDRGRSLTRADDEPTLPNLLRSFAFGHFPTRFYQMLQLALPLSAQAWLLGFPRVAGWLLVLSAFGIWALAAQRMERDSLAAEVYDVQ